MLNQASTAGDPTSWKWSLHEWRWRKWSGNIRFWWLSELKSEASSRTQRLSGLHVMLQQLCRPTLNWKKAWFIKSYLSKLLVLQQLPNQQFPPALHIVAYRFQPKCFSFIISRAHVSCYLSYVPRESRDFGRCACGSMPNLLPFPNLTVVQNCAFTWILRPFAWSLMP